MSTNPISTQFTSNNNHADLQNPMEIPQNMMGNIGTQPQIMPSMINTNNEIDPSKIKNIYNLYLF